MIIVELQLSRSLRGDKMLIRCRDRNIVAMRKFEFVVNLKAAKQSGLATPPEVLARASRLIK